MDLVPIKLRSKEDVCYNLRSYSGYLLILFLFNLDLIPLYFLTDLDLIPSFIVSYSFNIWILFLLKFIKNSKSCLRSYSLDLILSTLSWHCWTPFVLLSELLTSNNISFISYFQLIVSIFSIVCCVTFWLRMLYVKSIIFKHLSAKGWFSI